MTNRPYQKDNIDYIYSNEYETLIIMPLGVIYDLLDMWDIIIKGVKEKLTYKQVRDLAKDLPELCQYCDNIDEDPEDYETIFYFGSDYYEINDIFNHNGIMSIHLPKEMMDELSTHTDSATGEALVIIDDNKEKELVEFCIKQGWNIKRDNLLINRALKEGFDAGIF